MSFTDSTNPNTPVTGKTPVTEMVRLRPDIWTQIFTSLRDEMMAYWHLSRLGFGSRRDLGCEDPESGYEEALLTLSRATQVCRGFYLLAVPLLYSVFTANLHPLNHKFQAQHKNRLFHFYRALRWDLATRLTWRSHLDATCFLTEIRFRTDLNALYPGFWATKEVADYVTRASEIAMVRREWTVPPNESSVDAVERGTIINLDMFELMLEDLATNLTVFQLDIYPQYAPKLTPYRLCRYPQLRELNIAILPVEADLRYECRMEGTRRFLNGLVNETSRTLEKFTIKHSQLWVNPALPYYWPKLTSMSFVDALEMPKRMKKFVESMPFVTSFSYSSLWDPGFHNGRRLAPTVTPRKLAKIFDSWSLFILWTTKVPRTEQQEPILDVWGRRLKSLSLDFRFKCESHYISALVIPDFRSYMLLEEISIDPTTIWAYYRPPPPGHREPDSIIFPPQALAWEPLWRILPYQIKSVTIKWFDNTFEDMALRQLWGFFRRWLVSRALYARFGGKCEFPRLRFIHLQGEHMRITADLAHMIEMFARDPHFPVTLTVRRVRDVDMPQPITWGPAFTMDDW